MGAEWRPLQPEPRPRTVGTLIFVEGNTSTKVSVLSPFSSSVSFARGGPRATLCGSGVVSRVVR